MVYWASGSSEVQVLVVLRYIITTNSVDLKV